MMVMMHMFLYFSPLGLLKQRTYDSAIVLGLDGHQAFWTWFFSCLHSLLDSSYLLSFRLQICCNT
jgi:hypothetical protein